MRKNKIILVLAIIATIVITVAFLSTQQLTTVEVEYVEVVKANKSIDIDQKLISGDFYYDEILKENYDSEMYTKISDILKDGYTNSLIVKEEIIRKSRIVPEIEINYAEGEREIVIPTDWILSGGVQKGDKADVIFYGEVEHSYIGLLLFQDVYVKSVINRNGEDLYNVETTKYNSVDLEPMAITIIGDQEMALIIATLSQLKSTSGFVFSKYTQRSEKGDGGQPYITPGEIIGIDSENDELNVLLEIIKNENEAEEVDTTDNVEEGE